MNSKFYKYCAVPLCQNTTIKTPKKLFVHMPKQKELRKEWFRLARRDKPPTGKNIYYCEDHFDMPNDMENFMEYHVMGSVSQVRMKPDCFPTKFHCQPDGIRTFDINTDTTVKRQRKSVMEECIEYRELNQDLELQGCDENEVPHGSAGTVRQT